MPPSAELPNQQPKNTVVLHELGGAKPPGVTEVRLVDGALIEGIKLNEQHSVDVLAVVMAGQQEFAVIDTGALVDEMSQQQVPKYALARVRTTNIAGEDPRVEFFRKENGSLLAVGLAGMGEEVRIGRNHTTFGYEAIVSPEDPAMSSGHFSLSLDAQNGSLKIADGGSTNGSYIAAREAPKLGGGNDTVSHEDYAEDTVTHQDLDALRQPETAEVVLDEEVAEEVGEVAVEAVVEEPERPQSYTDIEGELLPRRQRLLTDLRETWGFAENATDQEIIDGLSLEQARVTEALATLFGFDETRLAAVKALHDTQNGSGVVYLRPKTKQAIDELIDSGAYKQLQTMAAEGVSLLPRLVQSSLQGFGRHLELLAERYKTMTISYSDNVRMLDMEAGGSVASILGRQIPAFQKELVRVQRQLTDHLAELGRDPARAEVREQWSETSQFRDEQVKGWAQELAGKDITPQRLEEITGEIENKVRIEREMIDDPNSPRTWFGGQIFSSQPKRRGDGGRLEKGPKTNAVQYVAELAADMLAGKYNEDLASRDPIVLDRAQAGGVRIGQHRAAALAMIYGKNWPSIAMELGYGIKRQDSR